MADDNDILSQFTIAELKEIMNTGTERIGDLYGIRRDAYDQMVKNRENGVPNFVRRKRYGGAVRKMASGGEVRGMGAAVRGTSFKGVF